MEVSGGVSQQISVKVDSTRAAGLGLSGSYISQMLAAENLLYPGGDMQNGNKTLTVTTDAKFRSLEDVQNMILMLPTGGAVRLNEVAEVELETEGSGSISKVEGDPCVILQVSKQSGSNEAEAAESVREQLEQLQAENPRLRYTTPYLASDYINVLVNSALENIALGVLLAAIVVFLFLRRWGATLTIAVSMPVCILAVFVLMNVFDLTMNMMSLGGIAMGVGMIVDNSIVVLENIYRYASEGHDRMESCVEGTKEVMASVMASTLTTVAVFLPLGLANGMAGMIFKDFCLTITFLLLGSLVIAVTWVPLLCYFLLDPEKIRQQKLKEAGKKKNVLVERCGRWINWLYERYLKLLDYFVHHLKVGMLASVGLVVLFAGTCMATKMALLPPMDMGQVSISVSTPIGSEVEETAAIAEQVVAVVEQNVTELKDMYYTASARSASVTLNLVDRDDRKASTEEVATRLRSQLRDIAGCEITITATDMTSSMSGNDISVRIVGDDYDTLELIANDLLNQISALPDAIDLRTSLDNRVPQVKITMKREVVSQYGLTAASVGAAVRSELTGSTATTITLGGEELDVVVKGSGAAAESLDALRSMPVATAMGGYVPLGSVADVEIEQAPMSIRRVNQARRVTVYGDTISGDTAAMTKQINAILENYTMPQGYSVESGGAYADMMENFEDLMLALLVALGLVYFILAAQFESFTLPVIIMMILPVAFTGALFSLPLTGRDLTMISLVSLIMLAGTVVNNSIILVDYIQIRRARGESREEAILRACPLRIRPVMMTTITTVLAMVPLAFGIGEANELMSDMGITMMSGMIISTVITLLFTPVYYSVIDDLPKLFRRKGKKGKAALTETAEPVQKPAKKKLFSRKNSAEAAAPAAETVPTAVSAEETAAEAAPAGEAASVSEQSDVE